ncbi:MAG: hypothetical protein WA989_03780 [Henriciella sp.]|uniref:hypothetical protein n=1 Tax=Henriciella sp. TaxID=1968823 RepID=UPI003C761985
MRIIRLVERQEEFCAESTVEEVRAFSVQALALEPLNSIVLAAVSYADFLVTGNIARGVELARRSLALNPANPFGWLSLCTANLHLGRSAEAHVDMMRARRIGALSPHRHWWEMACGLPATANSRIDEAIGRAKIAHALSPQFKPPLRYLIALHARKGEFEQAHEMALLLRKLEPSFVAEQLLEDETYPAATLRRASIIPASDLRALN